MGSYGIGPGRLSRTVVEAYADQNGIVWPSAIAPFDVHLLMLEREEGKGVHTAAEKLATELEAVGVSVLYDDRDLSAGEKFADADLIGIPLRVVVSGKTLSAGKVEVKERATGTVEMLSETELLKRFKK